MCICGCLYMRGIHRGLYMRALYMGVYMWDLCNSAKNYTFLHPYFLLNKFSKMY